MAELANVSVIHLRDQGSNLGIDRKYFLILEHYMLIYIFIYTNYVGFHLA
jgi:hypothetical protein